jgi:hypothetical protein
MDRMTRCAKCGKRMVPVITISGRTDLQCISCDDPAVKWADSPAAEKPIVLERNRPMISGAARHRPCGGTLIEGARHRVDQTALCRPRCGTRTK